jgi:hypothetical protein
MALDGLEAVAHKAAAHHQKINVTRYADDFVVTGASKEVLRNVIKGIRSSRPCPPAHDSASCRVVAASRERRCDSSLGYVETGRAKGKVVVKVR